MADAYDVYHSLESDPSDDGFNDTDVFLEACFSCSYLKLLFLLMLWVLLVIILTPLRVLLFMFEQ